MNLNTQRLLMAAANSCCSSVKTIKWESQTKIIFEKSVSTCFFYCLR